MLIKVYKFHKAHPEIASLAFDTEGQPPSKITFIDGIDDETKKSIEQDAASFDWSLLPFPDIAGFKLAIDKDQNIPGDVQFKLLPYLSVFDEYVADPDGVCARWNRVKMGLQLSTDTIKNIETLGLQFGMILEE